ncbi:MAG: SEL1-like repeat protein [Clostridia bacterium]|nr:SEL1-like repeat protein [Clostridia bacterium]
MNLKTITCPLCANNNADKFIETKDTITCTYCNASFRCETFENFNEKMIEFFDNQKQEQIANIRFNLWSAAHEKYKSSEKISTYAKELKLLSPDDLLANFYELACSGNSSDLNDFLNNINDYKNLKPFIENIVDFMLTSFDEKNILPLKNLITNTFENQQKTDYLTKFEDECAKIDSGMYASFIPRDVFVAYSSKDMVEVNKIVEYLENQNISCYLALRNLRHGKGSVENYQNELKNAITHCKCVLFISSTNSRSLGCDALKVELKYILENLPDMKRIEYILEDYNSSTSVAVKNFLKDFFKDLEHCRTLDDLSERVFNIVMNFDNQKSNTVKETKKTSSKKSTTAKNKVEENDKPKSQFCQKCGTENLINAKFCVSCGFDTFFDTFEEFEKSKTMLYCTSCQTLNEQVNRFCLKCGNKKMINFSANIKLISKNTNKINSAIKIFDNGKYKKATALFKKFAKTNNATSLYYLGLIYYKGLEVEKDYSKAFEYFSKASSLGNVDGIFYEGLCYYLGNGINQSYPKAFELFDKGATKSHPLSLNYLGECYLEGMGTTKDTKKAFKLFTEASEYNLDLAFYNIANCYHSGIGANADIKKAFENYKKAAELDNKEAQMDLANYYDKGYGTQVDKSKAFEWLTKACENGTNPEAYNRLGNCYLNGKGTTINYPKAIENYQKALSLGENVYAMESLGYCYYYGKGTEKRHSDAFNLFLRASELKSTYANTRLGDCYYYGHGVTKSYSKALNYYKKAAESGDSYSMYSLGYLYKHGFGTNQDYKQAAMWFKKAHKNGYDCTEDLEDPNIKKYK